MFDGTTEVQITFSGPCANLVRTGFSIPASNAAAGEPASGMVGNLYTDDTAFLVQKAKVTQNNSFELRNSELGTSFATAFFRGANRRAVTCEVTYYFEDDSLITASEAIAHSVMRLLIGDTEGSRLGMVLPNIEWDVPTIPAVDGVEVLTQTGRGLETDGNDELFAGEL
jgi:hypothetical protein